MEQTLQSQYNLIKEGKGNKAVFLKSAYRLFPDMLSPVNTFEDTIKILKNRSIISEGVGGLVTTGKKQDWHSIFNENIIKKEKIVKAKQNGDKSYTVEYSDGTTKTIAVSNDAWDKINDKYGKLTEVKEKEDPSKEVLDNQKNNFDYKDEKNYDNLFGQEFLKGYYTELKDPKNADKDVEELKAIVAKNLAKDNQYYVKDGQFGIKGVGYQTEAPGLGEPKEPKGKYKSSGYGDLKESVLRSQIQLLIKEVLSENNEFKKNDNVEFNGDIWTVIGTSVDSDGDKFIDIKLGDKTHMGTPISAVKKVEMPSLKAGEMGIYNDEKVSIVAISVDNGKIGYTIEKNGKIYRGIPFSAVKPISLNEAKEPSKDALNAAEKLYDKLGSVKKAIDALPEKYKEHKKALEAHLNFKFRD